MMTTHVDGNERVTVGGVLTRPYALAGAPAHNALMFPRFHAIVRAKGDGC